MVLRQATMSLLPFLLQHLLICKFLFRRDPHASIAVHASVHREILLLEHLPITLLISTLNHKIMLLIICSTLVRIIQVHLH